MPSVRPSLLAQPLLCAAALLGCALVLSTPGFGEAPAKEYVVFDNDWNVPGSYVGQTALAPLFADPHVDVLGITTVTGDCWRDEGEASVMRYLELIGRPQVPVANGAVFPLINTPTRMKAWEQVYGFIFWKGAWNDTTRQATAHPNEPYKIIPPREGMPTTQPIEETAVAFMIRQVHAHPHQVTILAAGPLTNIALAVSLDPEFAALARQLVFQGGRLPSLSSSDGFHSDFNILFDPEAAHIALAAPWARIVAVGDVSDQVTLDKPLLSRILAKRTPAGTYLEHNSTLGLGLWDELGAAIVANPSLITKSTVVQMDFDIDHGMDYGRTIVGPRGASPRIGVGEVVLVQAIDTQRFVDQVVTALQTNLAAPAHP